MGPLFLAAIAIFISILLILFRKNIKAAAYRWMYGIYHINYLRLFYDEEAYFNKYFQSKSTLHNQISNFKKAIKFEYKTNSEQPVFFQNIEFGINSNKLISILGKPAAFDVLSLDHEKIVSLEYNIQDNNVVDKYVFYFKNDHYYLGEFNFNKVENSTSNEILNSINEKYKSEYTTEEEFVICNNNGNHLHYKDHGYRISISYFDKNCKEVNDLISFLSMFNQKKKAELGYQLDVQQLSF